MWSSPAVAGPRLHAALRQAVLRAVDPASPASQAELRSWLSPEGGALGTLRLHLRPLGAGWTSPPADLPVPDPDAPQTAADLEATALSDPTVRRGVLAQALLGSFETDAAACGRLLAVHPLARATVDSARHPVAWARVCATLQARLPALRQSSRPAVDLLLRALLELASLSLDPGGGPIWHAELGLELGATGLLRRPLDAARPEGPTVPVGRCASCGVFGLALVQGSDGLASEAAQVHRVWAAEGAHRRFLVQGLGLGAAQCPGCGSAEVGLVQIPGSALVGLCADLFPAATGTVCPALPAAVVPMARRLALRRGVVDLIGEQVPGPSLVQLRDRLRPARPGLTAGWSEDELEWAIFDELGLHSGHALSAERLGLSAVHLAPRALALLHQSFAQELGHRPGPGHAHAVRGAVRLMRHAGAIACRGLDRWLRAGRNGLLLPRPFGGGGRSPSVLDDDGVLARRCRDLIRRSLSMDPVLGPDPLPAFARALVRSRVGRSLHDTDGTALAIEPGALRCTRDASALACAAGHRPVDVATHLAGALAGAPCPHPGCALRLAPAPRAWDPLPQLCATGVHTLRFDISKAPADTVEFATTGPGARLRVRIAGVAAR